MSRPKSILIVDDEAPNRELLQAMVEALGHECATASNGADALEALGPETDLVLLDVMMPGLNGFDVARAIRQTDAVKDVPIVMVTALSSREDRLEAVRAGADDFISKPVDRVELQVRTASLLAMKEARDAVKRYQADLEDAVVERTDGLMKALEELAAAQRSTYEAHLDTIQRLARAAEFKDGYTAGHIERVCGYCAMLAELMDMAPRDIELISLASSMHDVGKIAIPDRILLKREKLTKEEWEEMKAHTTVGAQMLAGSASEVLEAGRIIALTHHERWDGTGYPRGLAGEEIPLFGRICAVADVYDVLTNPRPDRPAFSPDQAMLLLRDGAGTQFDPRIVQLFLANPDLAASVRNMAALPEAA